MNEYVLGSGVFGACRDGARIALLRRNQRNVTTAKAIQTRITMTPPAIAPAWFPDGAEVTLELEPGGIDIPDEAEGKAEETRDEEGMIVVAWNADVSRQD
ncbi:hypothetical protein C0989_011377 [Termitomyces sp. Mn162]|nr:hypothetical protein C0989_011377 [Termitomyces sp. Mn162]